MGVGQDHLIARIVAGLKLVAILKQVALLSGDCGLVEEESVGTGSLTIAIINPVTCPFALQNRVSSGDHFPAVIKNM
jgi:hypothetical protein